MIKFTQRIDELIANFIAFEEEGYTEVYIKQDLKTKQVYIIPVGDSNRDGSVAALISDIVDLLMEVLESGFEYVCFSEGFDKESDKYFLMVNPVDREDHESYSLNMDEISLN